VYVREFPQGVEITDLSFSGAHVESGKLLEKKRKHLQLSFAFRINPNDYEAHLNLKGSHHTPAHDSTVYVQGVEFEDSGGAEMILLQSYIYQLLIAEHHRIV